MGFFGEIHNEGYPQFEWLSQDINLNEYETKPMMTFQFDTPHKTENHPKIKKRHYDYNIVKSQEIKQVGIQQKT